MGRGGRGGQRNEEITRREWWKRKRKSNKRKTGIGIGIGIEYTGPKFSANKAGPRGPKRVAAALVWKSERRAHKARWYSPKSMASIKSGGAR
jgi:hypothetical protein